MRGMRMLKKIEAEVTRVLTSSVVANTEMTPVKPSHVYLVVHGAQNSNDETIDFVDLKLKSRY
jgi:hypothetical protein